jgi:4'-phosphopantetheinyl transferase
MVVTCDLLPSIDWVEIPESLVAGGVGIVRVQVSSNKKHAHQLHSLLQPDEVLRARKYHKEEDHYRFLIARANLRILLGKCTNQPPAKINFALGANKKPLATNTPGLHYNISHCKDWVLIALAGVEVGIDIEKVFITQSPTSRLAFFRAWTRKEAFVKATAQGIDADFSSMPALDGRHYLADSRSSPLPDWTVSSFEAAPDYVAAIARPTALPPNCLHFWEVGEALFGPFYTR